jgi:hypothetical protein
MQLNHYIRYPGYFGPVLNNVAKGRFVTTPFLLGAF